MKKIFEYLYVGFSHVLAIFLAFLMLKLVFTWLGNISDYFRQKDIGKERYLYCDYCSEQDRGKCIFFTKEKDYMQNHLCEVQEYDGFTWLKKK